MAKSKSIIIYLLLSSIVSCSAFASDLRENVKRTYTSEIGVRELSGKNDGKRVEEYLRSVKLGKGYSWCAAFVCWTLNKCGVVNPSSAWAPALFPTKKIIYKSGELKELPRAGDVFGIYYPGKKRIAHVGFIDQWGKIVLTVEGNTNEAGSREGDGVYRKRRLARQIYVVSKFINQ